MTRSAYAWAVVALLWMVALLNYLDRQVIFSVLPLVRSDLHLSDIQIGLLGTAFLWVYGVLSPVAGYLGDRFGRARIIIASLVVWSAVTWATAYARSAAQLLVLRGLMGISEACYLPAGLALISDYHGDRSRSLATGLHFTGIYVGIVLGGFGGGWLGEHYGWRAAFTILGIAGVAYTAFLKLTLREVSERKFEETRRSLALSIRDLARTRGFAALTLIFSTTSIANWIVYTWLPLYLYERFGMSLAAAGFTATFYIQIGSFAGILGGGRLADVWTKTNPRGRLLCQAAGLAAAAVFLFLAGGTGSMTTLIAAFTVFGIGRGVFDCNAMPVLCQLAPPELRSTGYGIFNCVGNVAGGLMTLVAGALKAAFGLSASFQLAAVILFISAISLARLRPQWTEAPVVTRA